MYRSRKLLSRDEAGDDDARQLFDEEALALP